MTARNSRRRDAPEEARPKRPADALGVGGVVLALLGGGAVAAALAWSPGCSREAPPGVTRTSSAPVIAPSAAPPASGIASAVPSASVPDRQKALLDALEDGGVDGGEPAPQAGPLIAATAVQTQIYAAPAPKETRIGYIRRGGKVAVDPTPVKGTGCDEGWYHVLPVGYVCAKNATLDLQNPQVRLGVREPSLDDILPYKYAHNVAHGTPLYRNVPSRDEMAEYEPYLEIKRHDRTADRDETPRKKRKKRKRESTEPQPSSDEATEKTVATAGTTTTSDTADAGAPTTTVTAAADASVPLLPSPGADVADAGADAASEDESRPWWRRKYEAGKNPEVKLSDLTEDADKLLARRMVKGFYVAIDRTFVTNGRTWYKTTTGLLAPADRLAIVKPPSLAGMEIDEPHAQNPVAFVLVKEGAKYELDVEKKTLKVVGGVVRYDRAFLTGKTANHNGRLFRETDAGYWLRDSEVAVTEPGPPPASLKPGEKWIDVNLTRQTLVAFEGTRPVFATLVSSGRKGKDKEHDHTTPTGTWRIREKHVSATMDGDGAAAGDMPYSIEDVPYVMYFHQSYALHGAFWHDNFGRQQSHGCVNLAPLDAKRIFLWSEPPIPRGWHGMNATAEMPGTLVVVHE